MKVAGIQIVVAVALGVLSSYGLVLNVADPANWESPVPRIVGLLKELKAGIEGDGSNEKTVYDKFACWCEDTMARKVTDINKGKENIAALQSNIKKLQGAIGAHGANINNLNTDIADSHASEKDASEMRKQENSDFEADKTENEQCLGALEAATNALAGAGTVKGGAFLTMRQPEVSKLVDSVRAALLQPAVSKMVAAKDLDTVQKFLDQHEEFTAPASKALSAAQMAPQNPFGDFAPQSTQIQGILKGLYDTFASKIEKNNVDESNKEQAFQDFIDTKRTERKALALTLQNQEVYHAQKTKQHASDKEARDAAQQQLQADETLFQETKTSCKFKAGEWAGRLRLRTQELAGINEAIVWLEEHGADAHWAHHQKSMIQLSSESKVDPRENAYQKLVNLAKRYPIVGLVQVATEVKTGGHFDKVIASVDKMIAHLRVEEQADIDHRDWCEKKTNKNTNDLEDTGRDLSKAGLQTEAREEVKRALILQIEDLKTSIEETEREQRSLLDVRNAGHVQFQKYVKDAQNAIYLLGQAITALADFYKLNKINLELLSKRNPEYTENPDEAPATWDAAYGGRNTETGGIVGILMMVKEDVEKALKTSRAEEDQDQSLYDTERNALQNSIDKHQTSKNVAEEDLADTDDDLLNLETYSNDKVADQSAQNKFKDTLAETCDLVHLHFSDRRDKRKAEMQGLEDAKNYLAGATDDEDATK